MAQSAVGIGDGISEDELGDGDDDDEHPEEMMMPEKLLNASASCR